jgi:hypothetical protein
MIFEIESVNNIIENLKLESSKLEINKNTSDITSYF